MTSIKWDICRRCRQDRHFSEKWSSKKETKVVGSVHAAVLSLKVAPIICVTVRVLADIIAILSD